MDINEMVTEIEEKINDRSLAMDLLTELKIANKRLWAIIIILIGVLVATNFYWLYTFTQFDFVTYEQSTEGGGNANFIGNDGDIINGEAESTNSK